MGTCIIPAIAQDTEKSQSSSRGNWLYVGGSGPGNYTKIQDAIDNASKGDTVLVYDDSSPYYENIIINISINFIGENRNSTVIDGMASGNSCIEIIANNVHISNFTIQNTLYTNNAGIWIRRANHNIIFNNNIFDSNIGVHIYGTWVHDDTSNNTIKDLLPNFWHSTRRFSVHSRRFFKSEAQSSYRRRGVASTCTWWPSSFIIGRSIKS